MGLISCFVISPVDWTLRGLHSWEIIFGMITIDVWYCLKPTPIQPCLWVMIILLLLLWPIWIITFVYIIVSYANLILILIIFISYPMSPIYSLNYNSDNSTLANMLPGIIDSTLELVLSCQLTPDAGGDCAGAAVRLNYSENLPGRFRLLLDEAAGFEFERRGNNT